MLTSQQTQGSQAVIADVSAQHPFDYESATSDVPRREPADSSNVILHNNCYI